MPLGLRSSFRISATPLSSCSPLVSTRTTSPRSWTFIGDIASGAGISIQDLTQIYGKSMSKDKAQTEELMQMSERGIPILETLVKLGAESTARKSTKADIVYKAAERQGRFRSRPLRKPLKLMTAEGGVFHEQMEKQSQTMLGLESTVKDNVSIAFAELGKQINEAFDVKQIMKDFIGWLQILTAELKKPAEEQEGFARGLTATLQGR